MREPTLRKVSTHPYSATLLNALREGSHRQTRFSPSIRLCSSVADIGIVRCYKGTPQLLSNIAACLAIAGTISTTLGPRGMDKLIVANNGVATISNDGATILKLLEVVHPAAKTLVDIARAQDAEVGDGTTSVVLLAAELMRESKAFIEDGVSPHLIIKGYRKAAQLVSLMFRSLR